MRKNEKAHRYLASLALRGRIRIDTEILSLLLLSLLDAMPETGAWVQRHPFSADTEIGNDDHELFRVVAGKAMSGESPLPPLVPDRPAFFLASVCLMQLSAVAHNYATA